MRFNYHTLAKGTSCGVSKVEEELARRKEGPGKGLPKEETVRAKARGSI